MTGKRESCASDNVSCTTAGVACLERLSLIRPPFFFSMQESLDRGLLLFAAGLGFYSFGIMGFLIGPLAHKLLFTVLQLVRLEGRR